MPTFRDDVHRGSRVPLVKADDIDGLIWIKPGVYPGVWGCGKLEIEFYGSSGVVSRRGGEITLEAHLLMNRHDVTDSILLGNSRNTMSWSRDTGVESFDKAWKPTTGTTANILLISHHLSPTAGQRRDLGENWETRQKCTFTFTATVYSDKGKKKNLRQAILVANPNI